MTDRRTGQRRTAGRTTSPDGTQDGELTLRISRISQPGDPPVTTMT